nr:MAG TPA: hypothetical protein [Caudoviricetes sp.]
MHRLWCWLCLRRRCRILRNRRSRIMNTIPSTALI